MPQSNFVDYVKIYFTSGNGGRGAVSWRREKFVDKGGPDGGDGGHGGSIVLKGNAQLWTLLDLKYRKFVKAEHGEPGQKRNRHGATAPNEVLEVPVGTVIRNADTDEHIGEISEDGQELVLLKGGRGGLGNWHFRTSTNQTPDYAQPGEPGQQLTAILELKILADVGIVGMPNAGKSTLLSVVSAAKPEIADYPFTTLVPNIGIVRARNYQSFAMADIPGIIEGAHEGKGLGTRFLRHIERNAVLLFMVPCTAEDVKEQYEMLMSELEQYDPELIDKPRMLAVSQCDLITPQALGKLKKKLTLDLPVHFISSATGKGIEELKDALWEQVKLAQDDEPVNPWGDAYAEIPPHKRGLQP